MKKGHPQQRVPAQAPSSGDAAFLQAMQQAWTWYSARQWNEAEQACRLVLGARPNQFDALNLLGIIAAQTGRTQEAADLLGRAVQQRRDDPVVHNNYGNVLRDLKRHDEALKNYERATKLKPNYADVYFIRRLPRYDLTPFIVFLYCYMPGVSIICDCSIACYICRLRTRR